MRPNGQSYVIVRQKNRRLPEFSVIFFLTFLTSLPLKALAQQISQPETAGVPWTGEKGSPETTAGIMARQQREDLLARGKPKAIRLKTEREIPGRDQLPQDPNSPNVARWVPSRNIADNVQTLGAPLTPQSLGVNFTGATLADTGAFPPDSMGTVGPSQFVVFVNGRIRSFDKSTGVADGVLNANPDVFFASVMTPETSPALNFTSDPQIRYDRLSGRWVLSIIDVPSTDSTHIGDIPNRWLLAVSDAASSNALSGGTVWTFFFIQQNTVGGGDTGEFLDYPSLGVDANALYVGGNMFGASSGAFTGCSAFVFRKSSVLNGGPLVVTAFRGIVPNGSSDGPYSPRGVDNYDPNSNEGYFIGPSATTLGRLVFRRVSNPGGTPSISANILLTVSATSNPILVQHLGNTGGNSGRLDALDDRLFAAHIRNGRLWTAHNIAVTSAGVAATTGSQRRDAVRWYELNGIRSTDNGGTPVVVQSGTIFDTASSLSSARQYWIPSVMVSGQGHVALGFSTAGTPFHADAATVGRLVGDTLGTVEARTNYTASTTAYNPAQDPGGTNGRRWGDYSFTSLDPNDDMTMWTIQEFCDSANSYGVRVLKLFAPSPATPVSCSPSSATQGVSNLNIILTGTSTNGSGFFDPGTNFPNHISAAINGGGVTVNSATYSNPTIIMLNITIANGATAGARTIAVTNPDGQSATSATGILTIVGEATPPQLSVQPPGLAYGLVGAGQSSNQAFLVTNAGGQMLTGMATVSNVGDPYSVTAGSPFTVSSGQTGLVTVSFSPVSAGSFSNTILFTSNGGSSTNAVTGTSAVLPAAGFTGSPTSGVAPLAVTFTNISSGTLTNCFWDFGDGETSNTLAATVLHTYNVAGTDTVTLIASGPLGSTTNTQPNYITVMTPAPVAGFTAAPTNGIAPLSVTFTDASTGSITNWFWNFGDGGTTNLATNSAVYAYNTAGVYTVSEIVTGPGGSSTNTRPNYIVVLTLFQGWQIQYFGSTNNPNAAPTVDADGTGQDNLFKFVAGLDPTNPESVFLLTIITDTNQPNAQDLQFLPMAGGRTYTPQFNTDLVNGVWLPLTTSTGPVTNGNQISVTDTNPLSPQEFYRISISVP